MAELSGSVPNSSNEPTNEPALKVDATDNSNEPNDISCKGDDKKKQDFWNYTRRQFALGSTSDVFVTTGYDKWKTALSAGKGFKKHESCSTHVNSMLSWKEKSSKLNKNQQVSFLLNETVLEKRQDYFKAIVSTIIFLAEHELPFRGNWNDEENYESGLFNNLFKFLLGKDAYLRSCQEAMPSNATYTCPDIQNEIIQIIADTLREKWFLK